MKSTIYLLLLSLTTQYSYGQSTRENLFEQINRFMLNNVYAGMVNYQKLKDNPEELNQIIDSIQVADLTDKTDNYKLAFYINAYNLTVIKQVVDNYPISSPFDVEGFFKVNKFEIAGEMLTLDEMEFGKIMAPYRDSRVHFALGCAAMSCPFLYDNAFKPEHIQEQLEFRAQVIIDRPNYVAVDTKAKTVTLNKIFDWYGDQFSYNAGSLINFVNKYKFYKVPESFEVKFEEYNWSLNDMKR